MASFFRRNLSNAFSVFPQKYLALLLPKFSVAGLFLPHVVNTILVHKAAIYEKRECPWDIGTGFSLTVADLVILSPLPQLCRKLTSYECSVLGKITSETFSSLEVNCSCRVL